MKPKDRPELPAGLADQTLGENYNIDTGDLTTKELLEIVFLLNAVIEERE